MNRENASLYSWRSRQDSSGMAVAKAGRALKEFVPDYGQNVAGEFELWLEDANDYMAICKVTEPVEKRSLFLNLAGLGIRRIVK